MTFGLTTAGLVPARLEDVRAQIVTDFEAAFGANVNTDPESVNGQIIDAVAERLATLWEAMDLVNDACQLYAASGDALDRFVQGYLTRLPATFTKIAALPLAGDPFAVIPAGSVVKEATTGTRYALDAQVTLDGAGAGTGAFTAEVSGPIAALTGSTFTIETPISGWNSAGPSTADATPGTNKETDSELRIRYLASLQAAGASAEAIRAQLLRDPTITQAVVIENRSNLPDAEGRPGHSYETVVVGGADQDIVDTIWNHGPIGIQPYGNQAGTALDTTGQSHPIGWSRPVDLDVWIELDLTIAADYPTDGDALVLAEVLAFGNSLVIGQDLESWRLLRVIETPGIDRLVLRWGTAASPSNDNPIAVAGVEIGKLDSARVQIAHVP